MPGTARPPGRLTHRVGDATVPAGTARRLLCHVVNDLGVWGAGFVVAVSRRWPRAEAAYRTWHAAGTATDPITGRAVPFALGQALSCVVAPGLAVTHLCAQHGIGRRGGRVPLQLDALAACLDQVATVATTTGASVHCPRLGAGLAGGHWPTVEQVLHDRLVTAGVDVTVYTTE